MGSQVDTVCISHERLGDEVIIINLARGSYYSGSGTAADLWTLISSGATMDEASAVLASVYDEEEAVVRRDVEPCFQKLITNGIVTHNPEQHKAQLPSLPAIARGAWAVPVFDEYTDMWDLLQADPIHDVGETGWPFIVPQSKVG